MTVLCYGDSNTHAYDPHTGGRYPKDLRWTTILGRLLGEDYEIIPEGLNGRTTAYDRIGEAWKNGFPYLRPCIESHKNVDCIVFMLGTNDCNVEMELSAEDIAAGMEKLVRTAKEVCMEEQSYVPKIILTVPAAISPDFAGTPFEYQLGQSSVDKSRAIAPLYEAIAKRHGCRFVDASGLEVSPLDCEHLTPESHRELAGRIAAEILK